MRAKSLTTVLACSAAALAVVTAVAVTITVLSTDDEPVTAPATATTVVTVSPTTVTSTQAVEVPAVELPATEAPAVEEPTGSLVVQGGVCLPSEIRSFGTDSAGQSLVCTGMGAAAPPRWVQHATNDGTIHNVGDPCDDAVDRVAQDPSGMAILCAAGAWQSGP